MSLPSGSQCCRAVRSRLRSQRDATLIPEILLVALFEQHCATSRTAARYGSSVPGPLENRKRLGKRRMGELSFGHPQAHAPLWEFESLADLTKWKWIPPSPPESRLRRQEKPAPEPEPEPESEPAPGLGSLIADLRLAIPPNSSTRTSSDDTPTPDGEILAPGVILSGVAEEAADIKIDILPIPAWDAQSTPSDLVSVGLDLLLRDLSHTDATVDVMPNLANFCIHWRDGLEDGLFTGDAVSLVLKGIIEGLDAVNPGTDRNLTFENVKLYLYDATIEGVSRRERQHPEKFDRPTWSDILQGISRLQVNSIRVFKKAMTHIPESQLSNMTPGILSNLETQILALGQAEKHSSLGRQTSKMVTALERLEDTHSKAILDTVVNKLLPHVKSDDVNFAQSRLALLLVSAKLPGSVRDLAQVCLRLESDANSTPLSSTEICQIFLARLQRWGACGKIITLYNRLRSREDSNAYRLLSRGLWTSRQFQQAMPLSAFLTYLGREDGIIKMVKEIRKSVTADITSLANLAMGAGQPSTAIVFFCYFAENGKRPERFWKSALAGEALKSLVNRHGLKYQKFLETLNVVPIPRAKRSMSAPGVVRGEETLSRKQIMKTARTAVVLAQAPFISSRKAFHLLSECIKHLKSWGAAIPPSIARAIVFNITRDLAEGRPGKTLRLRWCLHMLREEFGDDIMLKVGVSVKRWRDYNNRKRRLRDKRIRERRG